MMFKIKDNVDLKELEKFGFVENKNLSNSLHRHFSFRFVDDYEIHYVNVFFVINTSNLHIKFETDAYGAQDGDIKRFADILFDLIQAGLVEKVVDND